MMTRFPENRDVYTAAEIAAFHFRLPLKEVTLKEMRQAVKDLARIGALRAICNRCRVRWPGTRSNYVLYSVRNHYNYIEYDDLMAHLSQFEDPECGGEERAHSVGTEQQVAATLAVRPEFPEDRDLYLPQEIASAVLGKQTSVLSDVRYATGLAIDNGWIQPANNKKTIRWPGGRPCTLYSVRNHELYTDPDVIYRHLRGKQQPEPSVKNL